MRPFGLHEKLGLTHRLTFVSTCALAGVLYDLGRFPGAVPGNDVIYGELFRLRSPQVWAVLDRYEGYRAEDEKASLFVRRQVVLRNPHEQTAWVYWYNGDPSGHPRVPSGNWLTYVQNGGERDS